MSHWRARRKPAGLQPKWRAPPKTEGNLKRNLKRNLRGTVSAATSRGTGRALAFMLSSAREPRRAASEFPPGRADQETPSRRPSPPHGEGRRHLIDVTGTADRGKLGARASPAVNAPACRLALGSTPDAARLARPAVARGPLRLPASQTAQPGRFAGQRIPPASRATPHQPPHGPAPPHTAPAPKAEQT
jgi:hypothetical protein